jgi:hypothetical protein
VAVRVGVLVTVPVAVLVGVAVPVGVRVRVAVAVGVGVPVAVAVGGGVYVIDSATWSQRSVTALVPPEPVAIAATIAKRTVALEACRAAGTAWAVPPRSPDQAASSAVSLWLGRSVAWVAPAVFRSWTDQLLAAPPVNSLVRWRIVLSWTAVTVEPAGTPSCSQVRSIDQTLVALLFEPAIWAWSEPAAGEPSPACQTSVEEAPGAETHPSLLVPKSKLAAEVAPSADPTAIKPVRRAATAAASTADRHFLDAGIPACPLRATPVFLAEYVPLA